MRRVSHPTVQQSLAGSAVLPCVFTLQTNASGQAPHLLWTRSGSESGGAGAAAQQQVVLSAKGESENLLIGSAVGGTCSLCRVFFLRCLELSRQCLRALFTVTVPTEPCTTLQLLILRSHSQQGNQPHQVIHRLCSNRFTLNNWLQPDWILHTQSPNYCFKLKTIIFFLACYHDDGILLNCAHVLAGNCKSKTLWPNHPQFCPFLSFFWNRY